MKVKQNGDQGREKAPISNKQVNWEGEATACRNSPLGKVKNKQKKKQNAQKRAAENITITEPEPALRDLSVSRCVSGGRIQKEMSAEF